MSSLAPTVEELSARNLEKLPPFCYAVIGGNPPGARIVMLSAGERGASQTEFDDPRENLSQAQHFANKLNKRLGVTPQQAEAMLAGACHGWHVEAADPETYLIH